MNSSGVPRVLRWLPRASLIKHAFEALCVNEFRGLEFEASEPKAAGDARTGEQVFNLHHRLSLLFKVLTDVFTIPQKLLAINAANGLRGSRD